MKKAVSVFLTLLMLFAVVVGCNSAPQGETGRRPSEDTRRPQREDDERPPREDNERPPPPVDTPAPVAGGDYKRGVLSEAGYESDYLNIRFRPPAGFIMATEAEMFELMDLGAEIMDVDRELLDFAQLSTVYEMMATTPFGSPNVILIAEKLMLSSITEEQYYDALVSQLSSMPAIGMEYTFGDRPESVTIAGESYLKMAARLEAYGQVMHQDYIFRKLDDRMICFIVTYTEDTVREMETLMSGFSRN